MTIDRTEATPRFLGRPSYRKPADYRLLDRLAAWLWVGIVLWFSAPSLALAPPADLLIVLPIAIPFLTPALFLVSGSKFRYKVALTFSVTLSFFAVPAASAGEQIPMLVSAVLIAQVGYFLWRIFGDDSDF